jgi:hypothetical protein
MAGHRSKQATISRAKLRARHLAAQNLELVTQDQQLKVLDLHAAATPNERAQQRPERKVEKRQGHCADPPNPSANGATRLLAPFTPPTATPTVAEVRRRDLLGGLIHEYSRTAA